MRPAYITATLIGEVGDHGKVVRDVQRGDAVRMAQLTHRRQHVRLGADVETGGRLVEHDHRRTAGERHGQADTLLLSARQLVRVAAEELGRAGQQHLAHHFLHPGLARRVAAAEVVELEHLHELLADAQRWIQRGRWILRHVRDQRAARMAQRAVAERQHRRIADRDVAACQLHAAPGMAEHGETNGGLARAGLADEAEHLARGDGEVDFVDDVGAAAGDLDPQIRDGHRSVRHAVALRPVDAGSGAREPVADETGADRQQRDRDHRQA